MPPIPYIVYGTITIDGVAQNGITVTISNLTAGGNDTAITDVSGNYIYDDLTQLPFGYSTGDVIRVGISAANKTFVVPDLSTPPDPQLVDFNVYNNSLTLSGSSSISETNIATLINSVSLSGSSSISETNTGTLVNSLTLSGSSSISETNTKTTPGAMTFAQWVKYKIVWDAVEGI